MIGILGGGFGTRVQVTCLFSARISVFMACCHCGIVKAVLKCKVLGSVVMVDDKSKCFFGFWTPDFDRVCMGWVVVVIGFVDGAGSEVERMFGFSGWGGGEFVYLVFMIVLCGVSDLVFDFGVGSVYGWCSVVVCVGFCVVG